MSGFTWHLFLAINSLSKGLEGFELNSEKEAMCETFVIESPQKVCVQKAEA